MHEQGHNGDSRRVMDGTRGILYRRIADPALLIKLFGISHGRATRRCRIPAREEGRREGGTERATEEDRCSCAGPSRNF